MDLPLTDQEREALRDFAEREDRDPRQQAARFVRQGLQDAGALERSPKAAEEFRPEPIR